MVFRIKMFFLSFNVKNGDLDVRWQLRHKQLKELEMDRLVFSRRKVLGQMAVSTAGILGLSATNKVFAHPLEDHPLIALRVLYKSRNHNGNIPAVGAMVTIKCAARNLSFSNTVDSRGGTWFNLHGFYWPHRPAGPIDTWIITVKFRGLIQSQTIAVPNQWSERKSDWNFDLR